MGTIYAVMMSVAAMMAVPVAWADGNGDPAASPQAENRSATPKRRMLRPRTSDPRCEGCAEGDGARPALLDSPARALMMIPASLFRG